MPELFEHLFLTALRLFSLDANEAPIMHLGNNQKQFSSLISASSSRQRMRPKNRKKHISVCLSGIPTTCNTRLFLASYMDSQMFPIDAPEDRMLKDGAGDVDVRKTLNSWKRSPRTIRTCKIFNWGRGKSRSPRVNQHCTTMKVTTRTAEEVKSKKGEDLKSWRGEGRVGIWRETPLELVIRLAPLLYFWWGRSDFRRLARQLRGVAEEAWCVQGPEQLPWTVSSSDSTINTCYSLF